jgi:hypothetical protein
MAKTQTAATASPLADFATGAPVLAERELEVVEMINWTGWRRPVVYWSKTCGASGWDTVNSKGYDDCYFTGSSVVRYRFQIKIDPDGADLTVAAVCEMAASNTGNVVFTVGGGSATIGFANSDNGSEKIATIAKTSTGTGWQSVAVAIERTSGASGTNELRHARIQDTRQTSSLPSPVIEGNGETVDVQDEGTTTVASARKVNFIGSVVTVADGGGGKADVTIAGTSVLRYNFLEKSADYTVLPADVTGLGPYVDMDSSGGARAVTLPSISALSAGDRVIVKRRGANTVTVNRGGSDTIEGGVATSYAITTDGAVIQFVRPASGSDWRVG